jgi:hypothetical protein
MIHVYKHLDKAKCGVTVDTTVIGKRHLDEVDCVKCLQMLLKEVYGGFQSAAVENVSKEHK